MARYRIHYLADGRIVHAQPFDAPDDALAIKLTEDAASTLRMELWCAQRRVRAWPEKAERRV